MACNMSLEKNFRKQVTFTIQFMGDILDASIAVHSFTSGKTKEPAVAPDSICLNISHYQIYHFSVK